jgi:hypothetical protein
MAGIGGKKDLVAIEALESKGIGSDPAHTGRSGAGRG